MLFRMYKLTLHIYLETWIELIGSYPLMTRNA